jgi:hypothetical protein
VVDVALSVISPPSKSAGGPRDGLARWTGETGDAAAAREQYTALLPVWERVSGLEHPLTLTARASLARWTGEMGDPARARDQYQALLPTRERVSGPEHPATLAVRVGLAHWTGGGGRPGRGPGPVHGVAADARAGVRAGASRHSGRP